MDNAPAHSSDHHEVKTLLTWKAKARPFKKRKKQFFLLLSFVTLCFVVLSLLFQEWGLSMAILSLAFLGVVLAVSEPHEIEHRITTQGVITEGHAYLFKELYDFWFTEKNGETILHIRTAAMFPGMLSLLLGDVEKNKVRDVLVKYIPYREVIEKTFLDNASTWLTKNFPLEQ